tara:strand:+ start:60728 stop:60865 length:138 start_codon:yes stop_codon:yes gene_type:complete
LFNLRNSKKWNSNIYLSSLGFLEIRKLILVAILMIAYRKFIENAS